MFAGRFPDERDQKPKARSRGRPRRMLSRSAMAAKLTIYLSGQPAMFNTSPAAVIDGPFRLIKAPRPKIDDPPLRYQGFRFLPFLSESCVDFPPRICPSFD